MRGASYYAKASFIVAGSRDASWIIKDKFLFAKENNGDQKHSKRPNEVSKAKELVKLFSKIVGSIVSFGLDFDDKKHWLIKENAIVEMLYHLKAKDIR